MIAFWKKEPNAVAQIRAARAGRTPSQSQRCGFFVLAEGSTSRARQWSFDSWPSIPIYSLCSSMFVSVVKVSIKAAQRQVVKFEVELRQSSIRDRFHTAQIECAGSIACCITTGRSQFDEVWSRLRPGLR